MPLYENCIHWRVCALACPLDVKECRHFKAEGDDIKHGHWLKQNNSSYSPFDGSPPNWFICSVCGRHEKKAEPYCNCGAKMDEDEVQT